MILDTLFLSNVYPITLTFRNGFLEWYPCTLRQIFPSNWQTLIKFREPTFHIVWFEREPDSDFVISLAIWFALWWKFMGAFSAIHWMKLFQKFNRFFGITLWGKTICRCEFDCPISLILIFYIFYPVLNYFLIDIFAFFSNLVQFVYIFPKILRWNLQSNVLPELSFFILKKKILPWSFDMLAKKIYAGSYKSLFLTYWRT